MDALLRSCWNQQFLLFPALGRSRQMTCSEVDPRVSSRLVRKGFGYGWLLIDSSQACLR